LASEHHYEYLTVEDLVQLGELILPGPLGIRDLGLLASAAARPQASAFGKDAYPDVWTKVAALLHSLVGNHALIDGNKRLGWLGTAAFLDLNGVDPYGIPNDEVYDLVMQVATEPREVHAIAAELKRLVGGEARR
jgi:death-on-curing protein